MNYISDPRPPLPDWIINVYEVIRIQGISTESSDDPPSVSWDDALDILLRDDELTLEPEEVDHALERLIERGYLYKVNDTLRVTTPDG